MALRDPHLRKPPNSNPQRSEEHPGGKGTILGHKHIGAISCQLGRNDSDKIHRNAFVMVQLRTLKISITIVYNI